MSPLKTFKRVMRQFIFKCQYFKYTGDYILFNNLNY